jgi:predicted ABC-type transport system involved in lysophospholipase L1 biosynthesis ATPase subunit
VNLGSGCSRHDSAHPFRLRISQNHTTTGVTVVLVTHTTQLVSYGTRALRMAEGQVVSIGAEAFPR